MYVGIYWNNHHHLLHAARHVDGRVLWANLHLLFWLSLVPFASAWMGENNFAAWPVAIYAVGLLMAAIAYYILTPSADRGRREQLSILPKAAVGMDLKGKLSPALYLAAIRIRIRAAVGVASYLRARGVDVAGPRPPYRETAQLTYCSTDLLPIPCQQGAGRVVQSEDATQAVSLRRSWLPPTCERTLNAVHCSHVCPGFAPIARGKMNY